MALVLVLLAAIVPSITSLCDDTCVHASDGHCDDGGSGSEYFDCPHGTDCQDCGSRARSSLAVLDQSLTRSDCSNVTIVLGISSPCALELEVAFYHSRTPAVILVFTMFLACILLFICGFGLFLMYAQTHYDLNPTAKHWEDNCRRFDAKRDQQDAINVKAFPKALVARSNLPHMVASQSLRSSMGGGVNHIRLADYHHRINTQYDTVSKDPLVVLGVDLWWALRQLLKLLNVCVYLDDPYLPGVELFRNVRFYSRCVFFVASLWGIAALLILPVEASSSAIQKTVQCVQESCQRAGWNSVAEHEFVCKWSTGGEFVQPNFWRDIVDVAQVITTVVVATFIDLTVSTLTGVADPSDTGEVVSAAGAMEVIGDMKLTTVQLVVSAAALGIGISTDLSIDSSCLSNVVYQNRVDNARFTLMKPESTWEH